MNENKIQRRDVLKTVGAASALGVVGTVQGAQFDEGNVRLVELGVKYDLPNDYSYQRVHVEGKSLYRVDGDSVIVASIAPDEVREAFIDNDVMVNGVDRTSIPSETGTARTVNAIPTKLATHKDPYELTHLTDPHRLPDVRIDVSGSNPIVAVEGVKQTLVSGAGLEIQLPARPLSAETFRITDEVAEIEGVPEHKWGPKTEYDSIDVEAIPTVTVRDRGKLHVRV